MARKKAVIFGAGNIGRGFLGQLFFESGYETTFLDVNEEIINRLNEKKQYPLRILSNDFTKDLTIENVCALHSSKDKERASDEISKADIVATSVGVNVLPFIIDLLNEGLVKRKEDNDKPLNILICENLLNASTELKKMLFEKLDVSYHAWFEENIGLIETSIGRMVPLQTPEMTDGDSLRICVEPYQKLPVDSLAFKGEIPQIKGFVPYTPFRFYVQRKLFIHNFGHALSSYCGDYFGYEYIWQTMEDEKIKHFVEQAMISCAKALSKRFSHDEKEILDNVHDLIYRFSNKKLGDTVFRVGRDLKRKLSNNDRMVGALNLCHEENTDVSFACIGIALAMKASFNELNMDASSTITEICKIEKDSELYKLIMNYYNDIEMGNFKI